MAFSCLPAVQQLETFWILAVELVPHPWRKDATTVFPVTSPRRKSTGARRGSRGSDKLFMSHGRCYSRWGRPRDWPLVPRAFFCCPTRVLRWSRGPFHRDRWYQYTPYAPGQPAIRLCSQPRHIRHPAQHHPAQHRRSNGPLSLLRVVRVGKKGRRRGRRRS